ncbi:hypothetical protein [Pelagicoccus sp. SDUM812003]|uniref:hypothetical protein n=1 Tax=Pelagicoccus sp. SDUM812003 TaxID=3041267 RepID=UPI00280E9D1E|nr:hypothetical protein [Pelagicoccus sp. SDUM812003]MDQ8205768.1 hypothetical protein [Pelagicoccus sp. SDUM812003]
MKKEEKFPKLYTEAQKLRAHFGGRIYQNRGHLFSIRNQSRSPKTEIGINEKTTLIALEGLSNLNARISTNKKNKWRYPNRCRIKEEESTFYLGEATGETELRKFIEELLPEVRDLILNRSIWFNHEEDSWFLEIPSTSFEEILSAIEILEQKPTQPDGPYNSGQALRA